MWALDRLSIPVKLLIAPVAALVFMVTLSVVSYLGLGSQERALRNIYEVRLQLLKRSSDIHASVNSAHAAAYQFLNWATNSYDAAQTDKLSKSLLSGLSAVSKDLDTLKQSKSASAEERKIVDTALQNCKAYQQALSEMIEIAAVQASMASTFMSTAAENYDKLNASLTALRALESRLAEASYKAALSDASSTITVNITGALIAIALSLTITLLIVRAILRSTSAIQLAAKKMASGDLTCRVHINGADEIAQTAKAFDSLVDTMQDTVKLVREQATRISSVSTNLVDGAKTVSHGSSRQADAASTIASTVQQTAVSIASISESADRVRSMAKQSLDKSTEGDKGLKHLLGEIANVQKLFVAINDAVADFVKSASSISAMTAQVKDIADQTNLLALNAAIEAARAGEQGRGFAVVADEVRSLAEKSAATANDIDSVTHNLGNRSAIVDNTLEQGTRALKASVELLEKLAHTFSIAHDAVASATEGVDTISTAVAEQHQGTENIARHIEQIVHMTEENNSAVQETSRIISELDEMANNLQHAVVSFKTE